MVCEDRERKYVGLSVGHECSRAGLWRLGAQRGDERSPAGGSGQRAARRGRSEFPLDRGAGVGGGALGFHAVVALVIVGVEDGDGADGGAGGQGG